MSETKESKKETKQPSGEEKHEPATKGNGKSTEYKDLELKYVKLMNSVSDLTMLVKDVMDKVEQHSQLQLPILTIPTAKSKELPSSFTLRKVNVDGEILEMAVYDDFVVMAGHKLKIYENPKGRFFNYLGRPVYLSLNGLHAL